MINFNHYKHKLIASSFLRFLRFQIDLEVNNMTVKMPYQLFIDGEMVNAKSGRTFETINPTDETVSPTSFYSSFKIVHPLDVATWLIRLELQRLFSLQVKVSFAYGFRIKFLSFLGFGQRCSWWQGRCG